MQHFVAKLYNGSSQDWVRRQAALIELLPELAMPRHPSLPLTFRDTAWSFLFCAATAAVAFWMLAAPSWNFGPLPYLLLMACPVAHAALQLRLEAKAVSAAQSPCPDEAGE